MIFRLVLISLATTLVFIILRDTYPSAAFLLSLGGSVTIFMLCAGLVSFIAEELSAKLAEGDYLREGILIIGKILGVAYLSSFGADICTDAGARSIGNVLETAGKIIMLSMAFPMLEGIFVSVTAIIR